MTLSHVGLFAEKRRIAHFIPLLVTFLAVSLVFASGYFVFPLSKVVFLIPLGLISILAVRYGFGYGILATVLFVGCEIFFVFQPDFEWPVASTAGRLRLGIFMAISYLVSWVGGRARKERMRATEAENRQRILAEISYVLSESLDYDHTLKIITELLVPSFADLCVLHIIEDHKPPSVKYTCSDPKKQKTCDELVNNYLADLKGPSAISKAVRERSSFLVHEPTDEFFKRFSKNERHQELMRLTGGRSLIAVPMIAHGQVLGGLSFTTFRRDKLYQSSDVAFCDEVAKRCAAAIFSARLYLDANSALQAREEFISIASHELKTPLTPLYLRLQTLNLLVQRVQRDGTLVITKDLSSTVEACLDQTKRLVRLVDDLLDLSRIRLGKIVLERSSVDLCELVAQTVSQMTDNQSSTEISVECNGHVIGFWDRRRIEQVVTNLLSNAIKYGEASPINITISSPTPETAILRVQDAGMGISQELKSRIFERFERGVKPSRLTGLGLGLYITRQIVEAHDGKIEVESEVGKGAVFIVKLPTYQIVGTTA